MSFELQYNETGDQDVGSHLYLGWYTHSATPSRPDVQPSDPGVRGYVGRGMFRDPEVTETYTFTVPTTAIGGLARETGREGGWREREREGERARMSE